MQRPQMWWITVWVWFSPSLEFVANHEGLMYTNTYRSA